MQGSSIDPRAGADLGEGTHPLFSPKKNPVSAPENYFKTVMSMATKEEENGQSYDKQFYIQCQLKQEL